jgi:hypothetical protein
MFARTALDGNSVDDVPIRGHVSCRTFLRAAVPFSIPKKPFAVSVAFPNSTRIGEKEHATERSTACVVATALCRRTPAGLRIGQVKSATHLSRFPVLPDYCM